MELMKLKKRLRLAVRGHKLMKDKFDELLKVFLELSKETYLKRKRLEKELLRAYSVWAQSIAVHESELPVYLSRSVPVSLQVKKVTEKKVGAEVVKFVPEFYGEDSFLLPSVWDQSVLNALRLSRELVTELLELASMEISLKNLASEMEKTRRRVNALEQILIPQIESQIRSVQMKLDELDREARTRVVKVKEMIEAKESELSS
jgi:V/A-type H+-transporting ATPase subunit D